MIRASREALVIVGIGVAIGLVGNRLRPEPLPLTGPLDEPPPSEAGAGLAAVDAAAALQAWEAGSFFLDARSEDEFQDHRVAGALPLPASRVEDAYFSGVMELGVDVPVVVYGAGPDSFEVRRVAQYLLDVGHADVSLVVCGVDDLLAAGVDVGSGPAEEPW